MPHTMHLYPEATRRNGGFLRRACRIERHDGSRVVQSDVLWYELPLQDVPSDQDAESYLMAVIMAAMSERRSLKVHGVVSRRLIENLTEFRDAWCLWLPVTYSPIEFEADQIVEDEAARTGALCAFSGGVDGTFSMWRHARGLMGHRTQKILFGVMVHGFDIPLEDQEAFDLALQRRARTLQSINVPLQSLRTNFHHINRTVWEDVHGAALASALACFKESVGTGIVGSGWHYRSLVPPTETERVGAWGSNPVTDHLLSGGRFRILHDGADHTRRDKLRVIADWPEGTQDLRVCWAGPDKARNCGRCEKCVRTMLAFRIKHLPIPDCFPRVADLSQLVREVRVTRWWWLLVDEALGAGLREPWVGALRSALRREALRRHSWEMLNSLLPLRSRRREAVRRLTARVRGVDT